MIGRRALALLAAAAAPVLACGASRAPEAVTVGSKKFTESVVLGELAVGLVRATGLSVRHRRELGGTRVLWRALRRGDVDAYPEYTGTLIQEILAGRLPHGASVAELRGELERQGLRMSAPLGFQNTYALGMREERAAELDLRKLSDLRGRAALRLGFSNEFMDRADGWPRLRERLDLEDPQARGLDHDLAYRGLASGRLDVIDLYSTDAEIRAYGLRVLEDDVGAFPRYDAVWLWREDLERRHPAAVRALRRLEGRIPVEAMIALNARVKLDGESERRAADAFLASTFGLPGRAVESRRAERILRRTGEHLALVGISLAAAIAVALPLGILAARRPRLGQGILAATGVLQTIPSLALLVLMIPPFGIGARPAVIALFLYSLLPIVRNAYTGLRDIPLPLRESAEALGLPGRARLLRIELPLAAPTILAGVKTAAVINVGTATLGALIGAGGYGQPILTGIRLDDLGLILEGAVPAASLALAVQAIFDGLERGVVPRGLRLRRDA